MRAIMVLAGLAATAVLAGCGSEPPAEQGPPTSQSLSQTTTSQAPAQTTASETPAGHGSLAQCLDEHGVPAAPGPAAGPPPGVDAETWNEAMRACATFAPGPAG
ncbi:hypothetical protein AU197_22320 [Mycobacterium sp. IS-1590]|uniref:hypothetical protein n=1 Tax=Mycobacterium sp. IS-1590 TaxID=1772286 RepID=UPI00074ABB51|nr:hypothetical protein [Mycobacterium sp. IS-1590]KUI43486.1 hypothetical protein AU197_22320 [Mycobacterium sp. IS-1590]